MKINRNNYEIFFIDFYDGRLTDIQKFEMELFLEKNPDLKKAFETFENVTIDATQIIFSNKQELKRKEIATVDGIDEDNYEDIFIAFFEDDLNAVDKESVFAFLKLNPGLEKEFQLHASLLMKEENIVFEGKELLKKKAYIGYYWYGIAATLLLLFTLGFFLIQKKPLPSQVKTEFTHLASVSIDDDIALLDLSLQLIWVQRKPENMVLPLPAYVENKSPITMLTSIEPSINLIKANQHMYLLEWEFDKTTFLAETDVPKKRGLLAQIFRKNVEDVTENLGIDNSLKKSSGPMKKDPGFVKFLDGSLVVFNTLTGSNTELVKNYDNKGNLRTYSLEGQTLVVSRKVPPDSSSY